MSSEEESGSGLPPSPGAQATIARNAFYLVLGQIATTALSIVLSSALGRLLGAADFGLLYVLTTTCAFAFVFVEWGQPVLVIREVAKDNSRAGELLGTALILRVVFALLTLVPVWVVATALGYDARTHRLSLLLILASLPLFLAQAYSMIFRARDRMSGDAVVSVSSKALLLLVALPALDLGLGIGGVVFAQAVAGLGALGVAIRFYRSLGATPLRVTGRASRELITGGVPILAMTAAISVQPYFDAIILSKLSPADVIGWFGAARTILGTLVAPAVILGGAAYPRLARASTERALSQEVRAAFRPLLWLGALAGTGTYLFARSMVDLIYGSRGFGPAATILEVFAPGLFLLFVDILLGSIIYASGRVTAFAVAKIISVLVGAGLDVLLIPVFQERYGNGGIGVVVAFALSEFVVFAGALVALPRRIVTLPTLVDAGRALGSTGATLLFFHLIPPLPAWAGIPLCVAVFGATSLGLGLIGKGDLLELSSLLRTRSPILP